MFLKRSAVRSTSATVVSPIPMGYGEATQGKKVVLVEFNGTTPNIQELSVPCFQELVRIVGSLDDIHAKLDELKNERQRCMA